MEVLVQIMGVPALVTPVAPAGVQNAPGVTIRVGGGAVVVVVVDVEVVLLELDVLVDVEVVSAGGAVVAVEVVGTATLVVLGWCGFGAGLAQTSAINPLIVVVVGL